MLILYHFAAAALGVPTHCLFVPVLVINYSAKLAQSVAQCAVKQNWVMKRRQGTKWQGAGL